MFRLKQTETFRKWRARLKDERARGLIASRLDRLAYGHARPAGRSGDQRIAHPLWARIPHLFQTKGETVIVLLCGGSKKSQVKDIAAAKRLAEEWSE